MLNICWQPPTPNIDLDKSKCKELMTRSSVHMQELLRAEEVKDEGEEGEQGRSVTLQSVKGPQAETNSIDNEVGCHSEEIKATCFTQNF